MEAEGAKILYQRSVALRGLRYIPFVGDGDSKAYSAVCQANPYGPSVYIPKEECIAHVTKRMGTGLRAILKEYKGKVYSKQKKKKKNQIIDELKALFLQLLPLLKPWCKCCAETLTEICNGY